MPDTPDLSSVKPVLMNAEKYAKMRQGERLSAQRGFGAGPRNDGDILRMRNPPAYPPCTTPFAQLSRIAIKDLRLEVHHRGTYILLRVKTFPKTILGIIVLAEDEEGGIIPVQLRHQELPGISKAVDIVNVGSILLIKEPYLRVAGSDEYVTRVDHLSDIVFLDQDDPRVPSAWRSGTLAVEKSAEFYAMAGTEAYKQKKFSEAIAAYSKAITYPATEGEIKTILRNRALMFLKTNHFDAALLDTGFPDFGPDISKSSLDRALQALYSLARFDDCLEVALTFCDKFPNDNKAHAWLDRVRKRCAEQQTGTYDFKQMQEEACKKAKEENSAYLDYATYIGPVEVRHTQSKGRGLFLTSSVEAGDLLLVEKAFAYAHIVDKENISEVASFINLEKERVYSIGEDNLLTVIIQNLSRNPSLAPRFYALYSGGYKVPEISEVDGTPVVDSFLAEEILAFNGFGCPSVPAVVEYREGISSNSPTSGNEWNSRGVWIKASHINHSCTSNVQRAFIGDMMIIRATKPMEPGTELTFWYLDPIGTDSITLQGNIEKSWGFVCDCCICQDARTTDSETWAQRKSLAHELHQVCQDTVKTEQDIKRLDSTYKKPASEVSRLEVAHALLYLSLAYGMRNKPRELLRVLGEILSSLGFEVVGADATSRRFRILKWGLVPNHLLVAFEDGRQAFAALNMYQDAMQAREYAKLIFKIMFGEDDSYESIYRGRN